jgi:hypothetical protein
LLELTYTEGGILVIRGAEYGSPATRNVRWPGIAGDKIAGAFTVVSFERNGLPVGCQVPEPDPFEIAVGGEPGAKLRFIKGEFYKDRVPIPGNVVYEDALASIAEIKHLSARAVFYIEVEGNIIAVFAKKEGAPLTASESGRGCMNLPCQKQGEDESNEVHPAI